VVLQVVNVPHPLDPTRENFPLNPRTHLEVKEADTRDRPRTGTEKDFQWIWTWCRTVRLTYRRVDLLEGQAVEDIVLRLDLLEPDPIIQREVVGPDLRTLPRAPVVAEDHHVCLFRRRKESPLLRRIRQCRQRQVLLPDFKLLIEKTVEEAMVAEAAGIVEVAVGPVDKTKMLPISTRYKVEPWELMIISLPPLHSSKISTIPVSKSGAQETNFVIMHARIFMLNKIIVL